MANLLDKVVVRPLSKKARLRAIIKNNPMNDDYHLGIRSLDDVKDLEEVIDDFGNPDITRRMLENAIENNRIRVFSSKPIEVGTFVTPSRTMAEDYAGGNGKTVYEMELLPNDIGWLNGDEGQVGRILKDK